MLKYETIGREANGEIREEIGAPLKSFRSYSGISMFLVGANSCWRSGAYAMLCAVNRRRETAPTNRAGSSLQLEPGGLCISGRCDCSTGYCLFKLQGSGCKPEPAKGNSRATL